MRVSRTRLNDGLKGVACTEKHTAAVRLPTARHLYGLYKHRLKAVGVTPLGARPEPALQFSHFVFRVVRPHGHALALTCASGATKAGPLPSSGLSPPSTVLPAPRTPAWLRALSAPALYARSLPNVGCQHGSRVFHTSPSKHAAHTPGKPSTRSRTKALCIAFAAK
jgi:hypothetical protein